MKKIINSLLASISNSHSANTVTGVSEVTISGQAKIFTAADLWNIQRLGKTRTSRRFI